jgi:ferritin-like metal-binding protein YciE
VFFQNISKQNAMPNKATSGSNTRTQTSSDIASARENPSQLLSLFENQLKDIYWAEKTLTKEFPKLIKRATSRELVDALTEHLGETERQVGRVEKVFESIDQTPEGNKCAAMSGLITEANEIMNLCEDGPMCDAGMIFAAQKIAHYEIASFGTLRQFAETLGLDTAVHLLETSLQVEKDSDLKLTALARSTVNIEAAEIIA